METIGFLKEQECGPDVDIAADVDIANHKFITHNDHMRYLCYNHHIMSTSGLFVL